MVKVGSFKIKGNKKKKTSQKKKQFKITKKESDSKSDRFKLIDTVTILNGLAGFGAIMFALQTAITSRYIYLEYATVILLFAVILDIIDGRTSRYFAKETLLGKELDSLADVVSFVIAPMVIIGMYSYFQLGFHNILLIGAALLYISCGIMRLAKFNVNEFEGYFIGVPTTLAAFLIVIIMYFKIDALLWTPIIVALGLLMISPFKVKKP